MRISRFSRAARLAARIPLLASAVLASACTCGLFEPKPESFVDLPTTVEAVKKLHQPPEVVVEVQRQRKSRISGGGACHSAVCLVMLPFLLKEALFPEQVDVATVRRGGQVTYRGVFSTGGKLLQASAMGGGQVRVVRALNLKRLRRRVIVEVSRARVDAAGKPGKAEPVSIQSQVDLVSAYAEKMDRSEDPGRRGKLLAEALTWLGKDAMPLVRRRVAADPDAAVAAFFETVCPALSRAPGALKPAVAAAVKAARPLTARALLTRCHRAEVLSPEQRIALLEVLARGLCDPRVPCDEGLVRLVRPGGTPRNKPAPPVAEVRRLMTRQAGDCPDPGRSTLLALLGGGDSPQPDQDAVTRALAREETVVCLAEALDPAQPEQLAAMVTALGQDTPGHLALVQRMAQEPEAYLASPAAARAVVLALTDRLTRPGGADRISTTTRDGKKTTHIRWSGSAVELPAWILATLHRIRDPAARSAGRALLARAARTAEGDQRAILRTAQVVLGQHDLARDAASDVEETDPPSLVPNRPERVRDVSDLVALGLRLAGCAPSKVRAVLRRVKQNKPVPPTLCL